MNMSDEFFYGKNCQLYVEHQITLENCWIIVNFTNTGKHVVWMSNFLRTSLFLSFSLTTGVTLDSTKKETEWNPIEKDEEGQEAMERANKLIVKQILLGVEAKDEYHVVEVI